MPFSLKNVGATYQRAITYIFHDIIHNIVEDYIDNILANSNICDGYLEVLYKVFHQHLDHNDRLNPKKCFFHVTSSKILGFIMYKIKTLRILQGKIQSIRHFIA